MGGTRCGWDPGWGSHSEVPDGLVLPFEDGLEGANVPFLPDRAQILRDERGP